MEKESLTIYGKPDLEANAAVALEDLFNWWELDGELKRPTMAFAVVGLQA